MTESKKSNDIERPVGPYAYKIYCHETHCGAISPLVNSVRPCPKCGSSLVNIERQDDNGDIPKTSRVPLFMQGVQLPEGANMTELLKGLGAEKKIENFSGVSRDERGEGIGDEKETT